MASRGPRDIVIIYIHCILYGTLTCNGAICKTEQEDGDDVVWRQENDTRRHDLKYHDVHNFQS